MSTNRVLVNSLPKSGTHLLTSAVSKLGYHEYAQRRTWWDRLLSHCGYGAPWLLNHRQAKHSRQFHHGQRNIPVGALTDYAVTSATMSHWLKQLPAKSYIQGHLPYSESLGTVLQQQGIRHLVILRDPRAVLVSLLKFIPEAHKTDMGAHFLANDFMQMTEQQQLDLLLDGGFAPLAQLEIKPFVDVVRSFFAWQQKSHCLVVRFEDLVGEQGGGNYQLQQMTMQRIAAYIGSKNSDNSDVYDQNSRTFRQGSVDGWKMAINEHLSDRIQRHFESVLAEFKIYHI